MNHQLQVHAKGMGYDECNMKEAVQREKFNRDRNENNKAHIGDGARRARPLARA